MTIHGYIPKVSGVPHIDQMVKDYEEYRRLAGDNYEFEWLDTQRWYDWLYKARQANGSKD